MIPSILLSVVIAAGVPATEDAPADSSERDAYRSAAKAAASGHDAGVQVRLALWCEAHGLTAERLAHLSRAVLDQPSNALARGLLGLIRHRGQWEKPEVVEERARDDPKQQALVREYLDRRAKALRTPEGQMKLAAWCQANRLDEQARAHYEEVLRLDPSRGAVWKHLGYRKVGGRWARPEQIAAERQEAIRQKQADKRWRAKLVKLRDDLQSQDDSRRARAESALAEVTDPRAVPAIWSVFMAGGVRHQFAAVAMLGRIDGPSASNALAAIALVNIRAEVRAAALEALKRRDPRDVVGRLIAMVSRPFKFEVRPSGDQGSPGVLLVDGQPFDLQQLYQIQAAEMATMMLPGRLFSPDVPFNPFGAANMLMASGLLAQNLVKVGPHGLVPTGLAPIDPTDAAQAFKAMEADPQHAQAILNQLQNNPYARDIPPGYTYALTDPKYQVPVHLEKSPLSMGQFTPEQIQGMNEFVRMVQSQQNNPLSPLGMGIQLGKYENNPAHRQNAAVFGMDLGAEQTAAQRDLQIGQQIAQARQMQQDLRQKLAMDVQFLESTNEGIKQTNARVLPLLKAITGQDLGLDRAKWQKWWMGQLDIAPAPRSSSGSTAPEAGPAPADPAAGLSLATPFRACFAGGTMVQTADGPRLVTSLQVGDRVLSQDLATGALEYQPVLAIHRGKPASTIRIRADRESIIATDLQRFWKAGKGWAMARDLKAGDRLRVLGGVAAVTAVERDRPQLVHHIDVAEHNDLFVGERRFLAHDFGFVPAVSEPFDRPADLSAKSAPARP